MSHVCQNICSLKKQCNILLLTGDVTDYEIEFKSYNGSTKYLRNLVTVLIVGGLCDDQWSAA